MAVTATEPRQKIQPKEETGIEGRDFDPAEVAYVPTTGVRKLFETPLVSATPESIKGYGEIVNVQSIASRSYGGVTEGLFEFWWKGDTLYARNNAVGGSYLFAWSQYPEEAATTGPARPRERAMIWRANYHPDGGQLFYPMDGQSFVVPLALPGDDVTPEKFVAFRCDGGKGLYIHPNIWHGAVVPVEDHARFIDRQGRVHARVSVDFAKEFGGYLSVPLRSVVQ
ncbi:uncharacterized protein Z519_10751 [Cladophialophora bantiana CBS 173.52]|uniref:Ureidoglycolate hydrolase n=1 Tax=Cladophialophora bantiana (strain ATCC 10958 / CBS 173.52 / CDC B-1940 / NIH 8579) TaxID=1442370 RepID=A0A0D2HCS4_CLAB1|nr:uncharacterized protein Z519_10751 [Cladophialophora bantiana CBS 173.52]KIW88705.1 hypothetical protein Z519_10751 [Cladophialophora bantiana CBS 173.52]